MKSNRFLLLIALISLLFGCEKADPDHFPQRKDIVLTRSGEEIMDASYFFSFNLFKEVAKANGYKNIILSPLSAQIANCMLANGAGGETFNQIITTTGFENYSLEDINSTYKTVVKGLGRVDTSTKLNLANSIWISREFPVYDQFKDNAESNYDGYVKRLDFSSKNSLGEINKWVSQKTEGHIPELMDEISPDSQIIIANALYFKGKWKEKFLPEKTRINVFKKMDGSVVNKRFMSTSQDFLYGETEDERVRLCEIPYGNGAFVLDLVLPVDSIDFKGFIEGLSGKEWWNMFTYQKTHKVNLFLPKFKIESDLSLNGPLALLGMSSPYIRGKSDFSRLSSLPIVIRETKQKAVIEVEENGTTATVSTQQKGDWNTLPGPGDVIEFRADHPFLFLIRETTSNTILFMGIMTE